MNSITIRSGDTTVTVTANLGSPITACEMTMPAAAMDALVEALVIYHDHCVGGRDDPRLAAIRCLTYGQYGGAIANALLAAVDRR